MALADEQGGVRRHRGTELIFMSGHPISKVSRPSHFIDARKAYDSVWREA
jgi:hypothetical protein